MVIVMSVLKIGVIRMKNKEKNSKKIVELACDGEGIAVDKHSGTVDSCLCIPCSNCLFNDNKDCDKGRREWAELEYVERPVISKRDRAFLDYLGENAKWMTRESGSGISVWLTKPKKDKSISAWTDGMYNCLSEFNIDFPMVKLEDDKPWLIEELKKLEVVDSYE